MISPKKMFAQKLKQLRSEKNLTQADLAKAIHVSRSAIAKWEQGRGFPTAESTADLCRLFGVDQTTLIDDDEEIMRRYYAREKRKKILRICLISLGVLAIAGGITGGILYHQDHDYTWNGDVGNQLQNRGFLCQTGQTYYFSTSDVVPVDSSISVSSIDLGAFTYGDDNDYTTKKTSVTFHKSGTYTILCRVYDKPHHQFYSGAILGRFYVYDPAALTPIRSYEDLQKISANPQGAYYLAANIDAKTSPALTSLCPSDDVMTNKKAFSGIFLNPSHYWISGLSIAPRQVSETSPGWHYTSLFGLVNQAYIDSLILKDVHADASTLSADEDSDTGAIASWISESHVINSSAEGTINGHGTTGGLFGNAWNCGIENCSFSGTITTTFSSKAAIYDYSTGGIAGSLIDLPGVGGVTSVYLASINVNATITAPDYVGGIIGDLTSQDANYLATILGNATFTGKIVSPGVHQGYKCGYYRSDISG
jgi:transcriptional regulator with XRE-family HTH domain